MNVRYKQCLTKFVQSSYNGIEIIHYNIMLLGARANNGETAR